MPPPLFDHRLRAIRRDRAARQGVETFLYDRAFDDCLDRLADVRKTFAKVLLAGCPNPAWVERMHRIAGDVTVIDPGPLMAERAGGQCGDLEALHFGTGQFDLCLSIGLLDTANDLPLAAAGVRRVLRDGGLWMGAIAGGQSLPRLRAAMLAADRISGQATPHVHPRIEAPSLAQLLTTAGFVETVVDIDRVELSYRSLDALVEDLRAMGTTNVLHARSRRPIGPEGETAARQTFLDVSEAVIEQVEILHFAAWNRP